MKGRRVLPWRNSRASGTNDRVREKKRKIKTMKKRRRRSKEKKRKHTDCNEGGRGTRNERDDRRARGTNVRAGIVQDHSQTSHLIKGTHYKRGRKKRGRDMLEEVTSVHYPLASLSLPFRLPRLSLSLRHTWRKNTSRRDRLDSESVEMCLYIIGRRAHRKLRHSPVEKLVEPEGVWVGFVVSHESCLYM